MRVTAKMPLVCRARRRLARDEQGSMAIAVTFMLILTGLSLAVLARTLAGISSVRFHQDFTAALASADAGLSDALFRIDQQGDETSTIGSSSVPVTGSVATGSYRYVATKLDNLTFEIVSKGTVNGRPHAVKAVVKRRLKYPHAVYGRAGISFRGSAEGQVRSHPVPGQAFVGSNGSIVVSSGKAAGDGQLYYPPSGSCSGCANPIAGESPFRTSDVAVPVTAVPGGCPGDNGVLDARNGPLQIQAGTYVCDKDLAFRNGTITVSGPVKIYLTKPGGVLELKSTTVNGGGSSADLQIFKVGSGQIREDAAPDPIVFNGVIYAPSLDWKLNVGSTTMTGALVLNSIEVTSSKKLVLNYDLDLLTEVENDWKIQHYTEVPSTSVGF